jgi:beta-galactosidase
MNRWFATGALLVLIGSVSACPAVARAARHAGSDPAQSPSRSATLLDEGWQLYPMTKFGAWPAEAQLTAEQIEQLKPPAPGQGWQPVHLPDDYVVRGAFSPEPNASMLAGGAVCELGARECGLPGAEPPEGKPHALNRPGRNAFAGHGYLPVYPAWYERSLYLGEADRDKDVWLDFGGVYRDAIVFVNGKFVAQHASGYTGFRLNVTSAVKFGAKNIIAVFVDPRWFEGWWYEGGGIYRHVRLIVTGKLHVSPWGTFVDAHVPGAIRHGMADGDHAAAQLEIQTTVHNGDGHERRFTLVSQVLDENGRPVAASSADEELAAGQESTFKQPVVLPDALLWSLDNRHLYRLVTTLRAGHVTEDKTTTSFGVRSLRFDPEHGFFLNGQHVEIRGMCVHQDFPGVGIAAADNLWRWRIEKLQAMGANAYRTAHSPVSDAFYDSADRMGMLVMAENRHLGDTYFPKSSSATGASDLEDVQSMVRRLRNHPSIIMWSFCNEEGEGKTAHGAKIFAAMKQAVKKLDPSRPVTGAINGGYNADGYIPVEDILGMNYHNDQFTNVHAKFPSMMIYGSEDQNAKTSRGTVETSQPLGLCPAYDCDANLDSGPWRSWAPVVENPYVAGEFVWTGFDYRGEPNPFSWPAVTSQTGAMDLAGFPKPVYYYWKSVWRPEPMVYIFPEWNLPQAETGKDVLVRAFSNCARVELLLNGKSLGVRDMPRDQYLDWHVRYAPGTLIAQGYRDGHVTARYALHTTDAPATLRLTVDVPRLTANGEDVAPIEVAVLDTAGDVVTNAENDIDFTVSGAGSLAGVANGDPTSHELNLAAHRTAFHGLAMVLVRAANHPGVITIQARVKGLPAAAVTIPTVADNTDQAVQ